MSGRTALEGTGMVRTVHRDGVSGASSPSGSFPSGSATRGRAHRVLIVVQNLPVEVDRRVWLECQALVAAGFGVTVICPRGRDPRRKRLLDGVVIRTYRPPPETHGVASFVYEFAYCWIRTFLLALIASVREGFDVVQACNPPDTYFLLGAIFKLAGKKFVFDQHDLSPELFESRFGHRGVLYRTLLRLESATYRVADRVLSTNESYRDIAMTRGHVPARKLTVVRSGPDPEAMRRGDPVPELRQGKRHLLVWIGIMGPQEGLEELLEALRYLVVDLGRDDVQLALLGFGDSLDGLRVRTRELGLESHVTFTGRADLPMIRDYLSTATLGLSSDPMSPLNNLSTMNKTLEYMAFELPVVAYRLHETEVSAGEAAVYVEPGDIGAFAEAVVALLDDADRRAEMGRIGRRRIEDSLSWPHSAPGYVGVFRSLTTGRYATRR